MGVGEDLLRAGYRVDRYELLYPVGKGGMGTVWAGRLKGQHGFEKLVAIKTLLPQLATDAKVRKMFLDEARIASLVHHINVVQTHDLVEADGRLFLVMEWIEGQSLQAILQSARSRNETIPRGPLLRILIDICAGLHAAHELRTKEGTGLGVVHRDVSPQNVLVSLDGVTKLIDFGVAKMRTRVSSETSFGVLKGKVNFMAPEQARNIPVDRRSDVWGVGALLYFGLTGQYPFEAGDRAATLKRLLLGDKPTPLPSDVPTPIARIVHGCLSARPEDRFATAAELGDALTEAMLEANLGATAKDVAKLLIQNDGDTIDTPRSAFAPMSWIVPDDTTTRELRPLDAEIAAAPRFPIRTIAPWLAVVALVVAPFVAVGMRPPALAPEPTVVAAPVSCTFVADAEPVSAPPGYPSVPTQRSDGLAEPAIEEVADVPVDARTIPLEPHGHGRRAPKRRSPGIAARTP